MKRLTMALVLFLVAAALGIPASVVSAQMTPRFAGVTNFSATSSGSSTMHLERDVEISAWPFRNKLTTIRSTGRLAGLVLKQDVPEGGVEVLALSLALCDKPPCTQKRLTVTQVWDPGSRGFGKKATLPAGDYFVHLIAERDTEVELHLPGLEGTVGAPLFPSDAVNIAEVEPTFDPLPQHNVYSAEAKQKLEGIGWALMAIDLRANSELYGEINTCLQRKKSDPVADHASGGLLFFSSCNGSGSGATYVADVAGDSHRHVILSMSTVGRGTFFHSLGLKSVSELKSINAVAADVSFPRGKRTGGMSSGTWWDD